MDFREVDRRYVELKRQYDNGSLSDEEFDEQLEQMMVQDDAGRWWAKSRETGDWHYYDGNTWIRGTPPETRTGQETPPVQEPPPVQPPPVQPSPVQPDYSSGQTVQPSGVPAGLWIGLAIACAFIALFFLPPLIGGLGIVFGYLAKRQGAATAGIVMMTISGVCLLLGMVIGAASTL